MRLVQCLAVPEVRAQVVIKQGQDRTDGHLHVQALAGPPPQQDPTFTQIVNIAATVKHENHC